MDARLDSIMISSAEPEDLRAWYTKVLGVEPDGNGLIRVGDQALMCFNHIDITGPAREPAQIVINLSVDDAGAAATHLDALSVKWIRQFEQESFGLIATVADPDGNLVQLVELASA